VCDPWAGFGVVLATIREAVHATKALAFTKDEEEAALGRVLVTSADWKVGEPLGLLNSLNSDLTARGTSQDFGYDKG